jgi:hypothetical protein
VFYQGYFLHPNIHGAIIMALRTDLNKLAMQTQVLARDLTQNQKGLTTFKEI